MKKQFKSKVRKKLSDAVQSEIKNNPELWKQLSIALGIAPSAIASALTRNSLALNQQHIVKMISDHSGIPVEEILVDAVKKPEPQAAAV